MLSAEGSRAATTNERVSSSLNGRLNDSLGNRRAALRAQANQPDMLSLGSASGYQSSYRTLSDRYLTLR
jgi:hypothetical protein